MGWRFWSVAVVATAIAIVSTGCGRGKLSAAATARFIHENTSSRRVTCGPGRGDLSSWDYQCKVIWRVGLGSPSVLGVNVNSREITDQTAP